MQRKLHGLTYRYTSNILGRARLKVEGSDGSLLVSSLWTVWEVLSQFVRKEGVALIK